MTRLLRMFMSPADAAITLIHLLIQSFIFKNLMTQNSGDTQLF